MSEFLKRFVVMDEDGEYEHYATEKECTKQILDIAKELDTDEEGYEVAVYERKKVLRYKPPARELGAFEEVKK